MNDRSLSQRPGLFWSAVQATLASPLSPEQVRAKFAQVSPRFDMATFQAIPRYGLHRGSSYVVSIDEGTFSMFRMAGGFRNRMSYASPCRGTIEQASEGSLIHVTGKNDSARFVAALVGVVGMLLAVVLVVLPEIRGWMKLVAPLAVLLLFAVLAGVLYLIGSANTRSHFRDLVDCLERLFAARCQSWCADPAQMVPVPQPKPWTPAQQQTVSRILIVCFALAGLICTGLGGKTLVTGELHASAGKGVKKTPVVFSGDQARLLGFAFVFAGGACFLACAIMPYAVAVHGRPRSRMTMVQMAIVTGMLLLFAGSAICTLLAFAMK